MVTLRGRRVGESRTNDGSRTGVSRRTSAGTDACSSCEEEVKLIEMDEEPGHVATLSRSSDSCGNESRRDSELRWDVQLAVQQPRGRMYQ